MSYQQNIFDLLSDSRVFTSMPIAQLQILSRYFKFEDYPPQKVIFNEDDPGNFMGIVSSGMVRVEKKNQDEEPVVMAKLRPGWTFGEMALLDGERRSATCIADNDCEILTLSRQALDQMLLENPAVAANMIKIIAIALSRRLRMADGKLVDL